MGGRGWCVVGGGQLHSTYSARDPTLSGFRLEKLLPVVLPRKANRGGTGRLDDLLLHQTFTVGWWLGRKLAPVADGGSLIMLRESKVTSNRERKWRRTSSGERNSPPTNLYIL